MALTIDLAERMNLKCAGPETRYASMIFKGLPRWNRAIPDSALDCIITMDASGQVVEFNPAAERIFGYSREEAVGKELAKLIIPPSLRNATARV